MWDWYLRELEVDVSSKIVCQERHLTKKTYQMDSIKIEEKDFYFVTCVLIYLLVYEHHIELYWNVEYYSENN